MTPTSACTTERRQRGFSLLEILLVTALLALFASIALPLVNRQGNPRDFEWQAVRLRDTMQRLYENSLFRGEMLALRLAEDGYEPLRYDPERGAFALADTRGALGPFELPEGIHLSWQLDDDQADDDPVDVTALAKQRLLRNRSREVKLGDSGEDDLGLEDAPPQLFFFPSGEVTPATLTIVDGDSGALRQLGIDALGRVWLTGDDVEDEDDDA